MEPQKSTVDLLGSCWGCVLGWGEVKGFGFRGIAHNVQAMAHSPVLQAWLAMVVHNLYSPDIMLPLYKNNVTKKGP